MEIYSEEALRKIVEPHPDGMRYFFVMPFEDVERKMGWKNSKILDVIGALESGGVLDDTCVLKSNIFILFRDRKDGLDFIKRLNAFLS